MRRLLLLALLISAAAPAAFPAQQPTPQPEAARVATREQLRKLLAAAGPKKGVGINFRQSEKQPSDRSLETVLSSIPNLDKFVGEMRPFVDGSAAGVTSAP